jgi:ABC-2 type transport system ATP-binding protein
MRLKIVSTKRTEETGSIQCEIAAENFKVRYDNEFALECPALKLSGNIIAVLGHNGAGKSTLIKSLLGLLPVKSGILNAHFQDTNGNKTLLSPKLHMAFCPESGAVFSDISVESYIKLWCRIKHNDSRYYLKQGAKFLDMFDIHKLLRKEGRELSKGQKRRVQSVIGFLTNPSFFLFDEPFDGLDVQKTQEFADIITTQRAKMAFLISSHRMDVIERLADIVIVLKQGEIFASGKIQDVCSQLAPKCFKIENPSEPQRIIDVIKSSFNEILINKIGKDIFIAGKNIEKEMICKASSLNPDQVEVNIPSLVDAMNLHLKY